MKIIKTQQYNNLQQQTAQPNQQQMDYSYLFPLIQQFRNKVNIFSTNFNTFNQQQILYQLELLQTQLQQIIASVGSGQRQISVTPKEQIQQIQQPLYSNP